MLVGVPAGGGGGSASSLPFAGAAGEGAFSGTTCGGLGGVGGFAKFGATKARESTHTERQENSTVARRVMDRSFLCRDGEQQNGKRPDPTRRGRVSACFLGRRVLA